jgi:aquaporin TIP
MSHAHVTCPDRAAIDGNVHARHIGAAVAALTTGGGFMDKLRLYASEAIGTFFLVLVGVSAINASFVATKTGDLFAIAAAFGIAVAVVVASTGHISGAHINPAVTFSLLVVGRIKPTDAVAYVVSQLLGGVLGAAACQAMLGHGAARTGVTNVTAQFISTPQAMAIEAALTFFLVLVIFGTAVDMRAQKLPALFIGLTVTADILVGGPYTEASMNPARSFGPALVAGLWGKAPDAWEAHWVYWVGPLLGGALAALVYTTLFLPRTGAEERPEVRPEAAARRGS